MEAMFQQQTQSSLDGKAGRVRRQGESNVDISETTRFEKTNEDGPEAENCGQPSPSQPKIKLHGWKYPITPVSAEGKRRHPFSRVETFGIYSMEFQHPRCWRLRYQTLDGINAH